MQKQRARAIALTITQDQAQSRLGLFVVSTFASLALISLFFWG